MHHLRPNTTLQGGKYKIERVLGQGGFGITYLAIQTSLNRQVAIKELFLGGSGQAINDRNGNNVVVTNPANQSCFDQQKERFKKEAKRLADLHHPNLVKVHEFFEENGTAYYVMDYIEGESLRLKLNREGRIAEDQVLKYLQQLTNVLEVTHQHSLWHLDIKPENVMVDKYGHITLIDFGSCKHIEQGGTLTTSSLLAFTPGYYPPEQSAQTMRNIGPWTDIYALGATLYNLLTNRTPPSHDEILCDGRSAFSFPHPVSSSTQEMIIQMMRPNRKERPQTVAEIQYVSHPTKDSSEETLIDKPQPQIATTNKTSPAAQPSSSNSLLWVVAIVIIIGFVLWIASKQKSNNTAKAPQESAQTESVIQSSNQSSSATKRKSMSLVDVYDREMNSCNWITTTSEVFNYSYPDFMTSSSYSCEQGEVVVHLWGKVELCYWPFLGYYGMELAKEDCLISNTTKALNITYQADNLNIYSGYTTDGRIYYMKSKLYDDPDVPHSTVLVLIYPKEFKDHMQELTEVVRRW